MRALDEQFPDMQVDLGAVELVIEDNWDPRLRFRHVVIHTPQFQGRMEFEKVETRLAIGSLFEGLIAPREIQVSGVFLQVVRRRDGAFNISVGDTNGGEDTLGADTELSSFGEQVEAVLERPALQYLKSFEITDASLRLEDLREGRGWLVDGARIGLRRNGDDVAISTQMSVLGGRSYASFVEGFFNTKFGTPAAQFGMKFTDVPAEDIAAQSAATSWLSVLRAPISGSMRAELDQNGELGAVSAALRADAGWLQPNEDVRPIPFDGFSSYLAYDPEKAAISFDELSFESDWIKASASGQAHLREMELGLPNEILWQLEIAKLEANPKLLDDVPVTLTRSFADVRLRLDPFELDLGQLVLNQSGRQLQLDGHLKVAGPHWDYALDGHMDGVDPETVLSVWPDQAKPKLRKWIDENIYEATLEEINLAIRSRQADPPDVYADFQFYDATVKAMKTMPPVENGSGYAVFANNQFRVAVEGGHVTADKGGDVDVSGTGFIVENTRLKQSPAHVMLHTESSVTAVLSLLDRDPLNLFSKADLPVDLAEGQADLSGDIRFVMKDKLPIEEVRYSVGGRLQDVVSSHFIPDKEMRADLTVLANNERVDLRGTGRLGALPAKAHWFALMGPEHVGKSWLSGTAELSALAVEEFAIGLTEGTVSGQGVANYEITFEKDVVPVLKLSSDLTGVVLDVPPLGWRKAASESGELRAQITLGELPSVDAISLEAPGLSTQGSVTIGEEGGLGVARLDRIEIGNWLQGSGEVRGRGQGVAPDIIIASGTFDMRRFPKTSGTGSGDSSNILAELDSIRITDKLSLTGAQVNLSTKHGLQGRYSGRLNGGPIVEGRLAPHQNGTAIVVNSSEGGRIAMALGLVDAASGGEMELALVPLAAKGQYDGELVMDDLRVQDVPAIAELLNAISVVGLIDQLNGPGISFSDVYSRFRLTPEAVVIAESSAVGVSMGISADGIHRFEGDVIDIQGTVTPIYALNVIGRPISRRGEGLIGFNYKMKGPAKNPQVSVNPLSVLTPGFFREIFRRPPPDLSN